MRFGIFLITIVFSGFQICHGIWPKRNRSPRPPTGDNEVDYGASGGGGHIPSNVHTEHILGNSEEENEIDTGHGSSPHSEGHHHHHHHQHHHHHHHHHHHRSHSPDSSHHNCLGGPGKDFGHYGGDKCPCKKGKHKKTKEQKEKEKLEKKKKKLMKKTLKSGVKMNPHKFDYDCQ